MVTRFSNPAVLVAWKLGTWAFSPVMWVVKLSSRLLADTAVIASGVRWTSVPRRSAVTMTVSSVAAPAAVAASCVWADAVDARQAATDNTQVVNMRSRFARCDRLNMTPSQFRNDDPALTNGGNPIR